MSTWRELTPGLGHPGVGLWRHLPPVLQLACWPPLQPSWLLVSTLLSFGCLPCSWQAVGGGQGEAHHRRRAAAGQGSVSVVGWGGDVRSASFGPRRLGRLMQVFGLLLWACREAQDRTKQGHNRGKIVLKIGE